MRRCKDITCSMQTYVILIPSLSYKSAAPADFENILRSWAQEQCPYDRGAAVSFQKEIQSRCVKSILCLLLCKRVE